MSDIRILPVLPLRDIVVFPHMVVPLFVGREKSVKALEEVMRGDKQILLATQRNSTDDDPQPGAIYDVGVIATVLQLLKLPDGTVKVLVEGKTRAALLRFTQRHDFFEAEAAVLEEDGVRVTSFAVNHGPLIRPAVGYRVDYAGHSVLISGDTKYDERVIAHGKGVDLLIHEVCTTPAGLEGFPQAKAVTAHHTSPEEAGQVFALAQPRMAAFTHFVELARPGFPKVPTAEIEIQTRRHWSGPLTIGEDLTRFTIADAITVTRLPQPDGYWPGF